VRAKVSIVFVAAAACAHTRHPRAFALVPFGAGQMENGEPGKALAFALSETATAATSAGIWWHLGRSYPDGRVPLDEASHVRHLQELEIGTGGAFFGIATWGVIDALAHWHLAVDVTPVRLEGHSGVAISGRF